MASNVDIFFLGGGVGGEFTKYQNNYCSVGGLLLLTYATVVDGGI